MYSDDESVNVEGSILHLLTHVDWTNPVHHFDTAIGKAKDQ